MKGKEKLINFIKENQIIAIAISILIAISVIYLIIFIPLIRELRAKYTECRLCENQAVDARNLIEYASRLDASYGERVLVSEKECAECVDELTKHGKSLGIDFLSMKPKEIVVKEGTPYKILPIELEIEATDKQFVDFLGSIDELKKTIVTVNSFDITPDRQNRKLLNAKMVINIYLSAKEVPGTESLLPLKGSMGVERRAGRTKITSWKRSPFVPSAAASTERVLNGNIWSKTKPKAMIGDTILMKGDRIAEYMVVDIKPDRVILNDGEKDFEIKLEK